MFLKADTYVRLLKRIHQVTDLLRELLPALFPPNPSLHCLLITNSKRKCKKNITCKWRYWLNAGRKSIFWFKCDIFPYLHWLLSHICLSPPKKKQNKSLLATFNGSCLLHALSPLYASCCITSKRGEVEYEPMPNVMAALPKYRWWPLFTTIKFGWRPLLECCKDVKPVEICRAAQNSQTDLNR